MECFMNTKKIDLSMRSPFQELDEQARTYEPWDKKRRAPRCGTF